jgi:hypothetical protein
LDGPSGFIGNPHGQLGDAPVRVDHLLQGVPRQIALNRHKVLHRAGARNPVHRFYILLQAVLDQAEHLLRDFLDTARQDRAVARAAAEIFS